MLHMPGESPNEFLGSGLALYRQRQITYNMVRAVFEPLRRSRRIKTWN